MKKISKGLLCLLLLLVTIGCSKEAPKEDFKDFLDNIPSQVIAPSDSIINALFDHPETYGIKPTLYELPYKDEKTNAKELEEIEALLEELERYEYEDLNKDEKISYDVLKYQFELLLEQEDMFYLATNYFDINSGIQSNLPLELYFYEFKDQNALDSFINILTSTTEVFPKYVAFEKQRQDKGYGLSSTYMEDVLSKLKEFNEGDHSYILEAALSKVEAASFLDDTEKNEYQDQLNTAFNQHFVIAYQEVEEAMKKVEIKTKEVDANLSDYENGADYYELLVYDATGLEDIEEAKDYLERKAKELIFEMRVIVEQNPQFMDESFDFSGITFTSLTSIEEVLSDVETKTKESKNYPEIRELDYRMEVVPEALQSIFEASAAYFLSPFDAMDTKEKMVLNGSFDPSQYGTIAHEGFPGHMYQHNYFKQIKHSIIRDLFSNSGYAEGWAVYADKSMASYTEDPVGVAFLNKNEEISYAYLLLLDIGIHYDGMDREEAYEYLTKNFGIINEEDLSGQYEQLLENPAVFMNYYGNYFRLLDLKQEAQAKMSHYSEYDFNKMYLDYGPLPHNLIKGYIEEDIN